MESKCKHYNEEAKHQQSNIDVTNGLPTVEPYFTIDTNCLHSTPETVREVEPQCSNPDNIENYVHWIRESVLDAVTEKPSAGWKGTSICVSSANIMLYQKLKK